MEKRKSSLSDDLFGPKYSSSAPTSSQGILASIFPPSRGPHGEQWRFSESEKKSDSVTQPWSAKKAVSGKEEERWSTKEKNSYNFEEEKPQPFHYSSSLYYGGQVDVYTRPHNPSAPTFNKDVEGEDDSGSASRGNWWQGSLYY